MREGEHRQIRILVSHHLVNGEHVLPDGLVRVVGRDADASRPVSGAVAEEVHADTDVSVFREEHRLVLEHLDTLGETMGDDDDTDGDLRLIDVLEAVEGDAGLRRGPEGEVCFLNCHFHFLSPGAEGAMCRRLPYFLF